MSPFFFGTTNHGFTYGDLEYSITPLLIFFYSVVTIFSRMLSAIFIVLLCQGLCSTVCILIGGYTFSNNIPFSASSNTIAFSNLFSSLLRYSLSASFNVSPTCSSFILSSLSFPFGCLPIGVGSGGTLEARLLWARLSSLNLHRAKI